MNTSSIKGAIDYWEADEMMMNVNKTVSFIMILLMVFMGFNIFTPNNVISD